MFRDGGCAHSLDAIFSANACSAPPKAAKESDPAAKVRKDRFQEPFPQVVRSLTALE
jgi:hypothetical protein